MDFNLAMSHVIGSAHPRYALLMLHGYGSNGQDMLDYAQHLSAYLPQVVFIAPDAPNVVGPDAYAWYELDISSLEDSPLIGERYCRQLKNICLNKSTYISMLIDEIKLKYSLENKQLGLLGFSQGGLLALVTGLSIQPSLSCVVASSSIPLVEEGGNRWLRSHPACLLTHGKIDEVVPAVAMDVTQKTLQKEGVPVETCLSPTLMHGIDSVCQQATIRFLQSLWQ